MHFTALGYSRSSGQTSDHWLNVARLEWEPEFLKYVRDAFAPVSVILDDWSETYEAGAQKDFTVIVLNDLQKNWSGKLHLRLLKNRTVVGSQIKKVKVGALGRSTVTLRVELPSGYGDYQAEARLDATPTGRVSSWRDFKIIPANAH
jgi:beta-galactosidase